MTMRKFLFRFGYCTPLQLAGNEAHGWDDESSGAFFVEAHSTEDALRWGREVADAYVEFQFKKEGRQQDVRWLDGDFANWIEENPAGAFSEEQLRVLPTVAFDLCPSSILGTDCITAKCAPDGRRRSRTPLPAPLAYFDYASLVPPVPEAIEAMRHAAETMWGQPGALHSIGGRALYALDTARRQVADYLGTTPQEVVFTSSGREALALGFTEALARLPAGATIASSRLEHPALQHLVEGAAASGYSQCTGSRCPRARRPRPIVMRFAPHPWSHSRRAITSSVRRSSPRSATRLPRHFESSTQSSRPPGPRSPLSMTSERSTPSPARSLEPPWASPRFAFRVGSSTRRATPVAASNAKVRRGSRRLDSVPRAQLVKGDATTS